MCFAFDYIILHKTTFNQRILDILNSSQIIFSARKMSRDKLVLLLWLNFFGISFGRKGQNLQYTNDI